MLERIFKERFFTEENGRRVPYRIDRVEIVLYQKPRDIARSTEGKLLFRDLKPYLQIFGYFSVVDRDNWSGEMYKYRDDIPEKYDDRPVYGIGMEDNPDADTLPPKRLVIVLSDKAEQELFSYNVEVERMCFNQYDKSSFDELIPRIEKADCQGVVIATQFHDSVVKLASRLDQLQIPYILIDAFIENTNCVAYYGTNSYDSGYIAGRLLYEQINPTENIAIFRFIRKGEMQVTQVMKREEGFRTYLAEKNYNGRIYSVQLHADEPEKNISILNTFLEEHKEVNAGIIFNSRAHLLGKYFRDKGENFRLIGYDVIDPNITCLNDGSITHLIAQRPEVQGFNCIRALFRHLVLKEKVEQINYMPIDILMKENIKYYNNYI